MPEPKRTYIRVQEEGCIPLFEGWVVPAGPRGCDEVSSIDQVRRLLNKALRDNEELHEHLTVLRETNKVLNSQLQQSNDIINKIEQIVVPF